MCITGACSQCSMMITTLFHRTPKPYHSTARQRVLFFTGILPSQNLEPSSTPASSSESGSEPSPRAIHAHLSVPAGRALRPALTRNGASTARFLRVEKRCGGMRDGGRSRNVCMFGMNACEGISLKNTSGGMSCDLIAAWQRPDFCVTLSTPGSTSSSPETYGNSVAVRRSPGSPAGLGSTSHSQK